MGDPVAPEEAGGEGGDRQAQTLHVRLDAGEGLGGEIKRLQPLVLEEFYKP